jgi:4-amino-4-deoxy-L-arabinose transferase-like glycosyltransferase
MTTLTRPNLGIARGRFDAAALGGLVRGSTRDAAWVRPALIAVSALAAVIYFWNLTLNGYANTYYSAAALAASKDWAAWFFGSIDASNFITVDKPPLSTMVMGLSVRLFGLSSWSILLPEAVMGMASVVILYSAVRRSFGAAAGLIAALVLAVTPVAALMFRFDNPDALLTLLLVAAAWSFLKALEEGRLRWVVLAATFVGFGFLAKYLQAYLVLPAFILTYAIAAPGSVRRRLGHLLVAGLTVVAASGWWVLIVELVPASMRPYIGGSTNNSVLDLIFGYDGLGRIFGGSGGQGGGAGGAGGGGFGGAAGILRLANSQFATQITWLLPFAGLSLLSGLLVRARAARTDRARAGYLMWGLWLGVHALVFSYMSGIIHSYYTIVMAPAIGALVGAGVVELWRLRARFAWGGLVMGVGIVVTAWWSAHLLDLTPSFMPGLGLGIIGVGVAAALIHAVPAAYQVRWISVAGVILGVAAMLAGPAASTLYTINAAYSGSIVSAGPAVADAQNGGGRVAFGSAQPPSGGFAGVGGVSQSGSVTALADYLVANRGTATWIVATSGSGSADTIELATGAPVMAMGGFTGSDPAPTLDQLKAYVASGQLRYVFIGGQNGPGGSSAITRWVTTYGAAVDYGTSGNGTLYDLSGAIAAGG